MKVIVIGYGSIGSRHASVLTELGCRVALVSRRNIDFDLCYSSLKKALVEEQPEYVIIANKTGDHFETLRVLDELGFKGTILIEKPLFQFAQPFSNFGNNNIFVAYNLRFHPLIQKLHDFLRSENIISIMAYVGQYLPEWRPQLDYRLNYSAKKEEGGGVLRDLSHELDYLNWICGGWKNITAIGGHYSHLEINSDDSFSVMMTTERCPSVMVQMNYLDRISHRIILVNTDQHTIKVDFIKGTFQIDAEVEQVQVERNDTYLAQHQSVLDHRFDQLCTLEEGMDVMKMIQAIENSAYADRERWEHK